jgi:transcriptional regulator with XRE-family HTH domain
LALLGCTDEELAEALGVSEQMINNWKKSHVEFSLAIREGKRLADSKVAERLYERACGYSRPEEKIFQHNGDITRAENT